MLSSTLEKFKEGYKLRLTTYLDKWADNTESSFLEIELSNYTQYYDALTSLQNLFKDRTEKDLKGTHIYAGRVLELKNIDEKIYNDIVKELESDNADINFDRYLTLEEITKKLIEIDFTKLKNYITSAKRILEFINNKHIISKKPGVPENKTETSKPDNPLPSASAGATHHDDLNDYTRSTIEDCLFDIVNDINPNHYKILVDALFSYFTTGKFPKMDKKIIFNRVNKKKVGWALKEAYMNLKTENLSVEYFQFAKDNINLFEMEEIEHKEFKKSRFYKYFTTNPAK